MPNIKIFEILYGRAPSPAEIERMNVLSPYDNSAVSVRKIIGLFDRQTNPSPVSVRFSKDELQLLNIQNVKVWADRYDMAVSSELICTNNYEPHFIRFLKNHVRSGMTVVDVGANIGVLTMLAANLVGKNGKVFAFEPNSENCRLIKLSAMENQFEDRIRIIPIALSDQSKPVFFTPAIGSNGVILPEESIFNPNCIVVPAFRMDQILNEKIDFLKLDIEGAEYLALVGAEDIIRKYKPIITVEFSLEMIKRQSGIDGVDFLDWISKIGYDGHILGRTGKEEPIGNLNTFKDRWDDFLRIEDIAFFPKE